MLRLAAKHVEHDPERVRRELGLAQEMLERALCELREIGRGLHLAILTNPAWRPRSKRS